MFDILGVSLLVAVIAAFAWLTWRAWHATRMVVKWAGAGLSGLLTFVLAAALVIALVGFYKLNRKYDNPVPQISVDITPERIARGERFGELCAGCHAADATPPMEGQDFLAEGGPPVGTIYAPNLTPTHLGDWTDGEIIRAIREGVHRSGRSLIIMPSSMFRNLSDDDVQAVVAYLRSQPAVEPDGPPMRLNVLGAIMIGLAPVFEAQPPISEPIVAPPEGPTAEYGAYLVSFTCTLCHGEDLGGDEVFGAPGLAASATWSEEQFITLIRTGVKPNGTEVDGEQMPWEDISKLFDDDDELRAVFAHIRSLIP